MSSDPGFLDYVLDQIGMERDLVHKRLFGEYGLWLDGRIVALVCDDQLLVKPTAAGRDLLGGSPAEALPYPQAKPWLLIEDLDDGAFLRRLLRATADALPPARARRSPNGRGDTAR